MDRESILAEALGQTVNLEDWQKYMKDGFVVDLKIKRWRARKKLTLYELGIVPPTPEAAQAYEELINLGTNVLLPVQTLKDLESIERQARQCLKNCTFETPFGRFLPYTAYAVWKFGNEEYKRRFLAMRDEIIASYPALVEELLTQYVQVPKHAYFLLKKQYDLIDYTAFIDFTKTFPDEESFVRHFRTNIIA